MNNNTLNSMGLPMGTTPQQQRFAMQQFQNSLAQQGVQNQAQLQHQQQQQHQPVDQSWQVNCSREMRDQQIRTLEASLAILFKNNQQLQKVAQLTPQIYRNLATKAEDLAWGKAASMTEYQQLCTQNAQLIARWQLQKLAQQQIGISGQQQTDQQQQQAAQMQMLLQQNAQNQQQQHQTQQGQIPQTQQQNQQLQLQQMAAAQNPQGLNMASFQRNFPGQQDTSSTLTATMQNFIQQQQLSQQQQQQRAQQQTPQQQQQQIPQTGTQAQSQQAGQATQLLRQQFQNANQGNQNMLTAANIYGQQQQPQQSYAANLAAAAQRQSGLSNLNQPINPTMQNSQAQQTPQQRPGQFTQMPDASTAAMFNQVRNPLQSPAQLTPAELQKLAEDLGNYRYYSAVLSKPGRVPEIPAHMKQQYDAAIARLNSAKASHPNLNEQLKTLMNAHMQKLDAARATQAGGAAAGAAAEGQGMGIVQQSMQQPLQQGQTGAAARAQLNQRATAPGIFPQMQHPRPQAQSAQAQATQQHPGSDFTNQQPTPQVAQSLLQSGQVPNISNITPEQMQLLQQMRLQQQRQYQSSQQLLNNLQSGNVGGTPQLNSMQMQQLQAQLAQQAQHQQAQQVQQAQQIQRPGEANPNAIVPNRLIPESANPHNFLIPFETQQRLTQIGIPAERLGSWKEAIDWLSEAAKTGGIGEDAFNKVRHEYTLVYQQMTTNPRAFLATQQMQRNMVNQNQNQNQMLMNQMAQRQQQLGQQGQKLGMQQGLQNVQAGLHPPVQINMANLQQQMAQQIPQPQAQQLQTQTSQQSQQPPQPQQQIPAPQQQLPQQQQQGQQAQQQQQQLAATQQRKPPTRAAPKKANKKGSDPANPMVIGNTPTPTSMPTPSPAQMAAQLPTTTPMNVASPNLPLPAATPQGLGISPADTQTPPQGQPMQIADGQIAHQTAQAFVNANIQKIRSMMLAGAVNLQVKNLTPEEKEQMRGFLGNAQTQEFIARIDRLAPVMLIITKDENRTIEFLRLQQLAMMIRDAASKDRHICTPQDWLQNYWPSIYRQVTFILNAIQNRGVTRSHPPPAPIAATSPSNPAGISISFSNKPTLRQEDLRLPEAKRRFSAGPGASSSPASTADPATVPALVQTPITMATPVPMSAFPSQTSAAKRPSTGSPSTGPPNKMQISASGPIPVRDRTQDEAVAKRLAREQADAQARLEAKKDPLQYVKNAAMKIIPADMVEKNGVPARSQPVYQGLADQVKKEDNKPGTTPAADVRASVSRATPQNGVKGQLPSPPWSGTMATRTLAEAFQNTTDIDFSLKSLYSHEPAVESFTGLSGSTAVDCEEEDKLVQEELDVMGFLSPLGEDLEFNDPYAWASDLKFSWSGDLFGDGIVA